MSEGLDSGFRDQDVDLAFYGIQSDGVVCCVWSEDCDGVAGREGVDGGFVGVGVDFVVCGEGGEGCVEAIVELCDVFVQMLTWKSGQLVLRF